MNDTTGTIAACWANYIDHPESLDIHFLGKPIDATGKPDWPRGVTPRHGTLATRLPFKDSSDFVHDAKFSLKSPLGFSRLSYAVALRRRAGEMVFVPIHPQDDVSIFQSPSGGGNGCPA